MRSDIPDLKKNWNFPKIHTHLHAPADIRAKGVTRNYNTKPSEKAHGSLKQAYKRQTNFKKRSWSGRLSFIIAGVYVII